MSAENDPELFASSCFWPNWCELHDTHPKNCERWHVTKEPEKHMSTETRVQEKLGELVKLIELEAQERVRVEVLEKLQVALGGKLTMLAPKPATNGTSEPKPRRRRQTSVRKPGGFGAMTGAILETLKAAPAGLRARDIIPRVIKRLPEAEAHTIGVMLSNLRRRGRIIKRGQKPKSVYSLPKA